MCVSRLERVGLDAATKKRDVAHIGGVGCAHILRAERARHAVAFRAAKMFAEVILGDA